MEKGEKAEREKKAEKAENETKADTKTIQAVVEATTQKYGGGVKLEGTFYNLSEGLELPGKGEEIVARIQGRTIVEWRRAEDGQRGEGKGKEKGKEKDEQKGEQAEEALGLPDDIEVPEGVRAVTEVFLAILKHIDERMPNMATKDKIIVASVIFKEIMETRRIKIKRKSGE